MTHAVVIGNGESRRHVDWQLWTAHTLIGCNAVHRDLPVAHLICCDRRMAEEATANTAMQHTQIYVRQRWHHYFRKIKKNKNVQLLPPVPTEANAKRDDPDHWGSGPYAVLLAAALGHTHIDLIGFDLYPLDHTVNNMYKGTVNYAASGSQAVDPSYWIYQIAAVFDHWPNIQFQIHNKVAWLLPVLWQKNNVKLVAL